MNGIFIVDARTEQTISWTQDLSSVAFGDNIELNATATSNLAVTFDIADESLPNFWLPVRSIYRLGGDWTETVHPWRWKPQVMKMVLTTSIGWSHQRYRKVR